MNHHKVVVEEDGICDFHVSNEDFGRGSEEVAVLGPLKGDDDGTTWGQCVIQG